MATRKPAERKVVAYAIHVYGAPETQLSYDFVQGMANRVSVSYHKYGSWEASAKTVDFMACITQRLDKYRETANTEFLIDAANFCMGEFMFPSVEGAHFTATDSSGSPGITLQDGSVINERPPGS